MIAKGNDTGREEDGELIVVVGVNSVVSADFGGSLVEDLIFFASFEIFVFPLFVGGGVDWSR